MSLRIALLALADVLIGSAILIVEFRYHLPALLAVLALAGVGVALCIVAYTQALKRTSATTTLLGFRSYLAALPEGARRIPLDDQVWPDQQEEHQPTP